MLTYEPFINHLTVDFLSLGQMVFSDTALICNLQLTCFSKKSCTVSWQMRWQICKPVCSSEPILLSPKPLVMRSLGIIKLHDSMEFK